MNSFSLKKGIAELFIVINHGIDEIHHGLCHTEDVCRLAEPSFIGKEIIGHTDPGTVVLHLQIVEKLIILGTGEIIIIALVVLLLFGGKKIPELMRGIGKGVKSFKDGMNDIEKQINAEPEETPAKQDDNK